MSSPSTGVSYRRVALAITLSVGTIVFHTLLCILLSYSILDLISPHSRINAGRYSKQMNESNPTVLNSYDPTQFPGNAASTSKSNSSAQATMGGENASLKTFNATIPLVTPPDSSEWSWSAGRGEKMIYFDSRKNKELGIRTQKLLVLRISCRNQVPINWKLLVNFTEPPAFVTIFLIYLESIVERYVFINHTTVTIKTLWTNFFPEVLSFKP